MHRVLSGRSVVFSVVIREWFNINARYTGFCLKYNRDAPFFMWNVSYVTEAELNVFTTWNTDLIRAPKTSSLWVFLFKIVPITLVSWLLRHRMVFNKFLFMFNFHLHFWSDFFLCDLYTQNLFNQTSFITWLTHGFEKC